MNFNDALKTLLDKKCVGIRPNRNSNYMELYRPKWMNPRSLDFMLRWHNSDSDEGIRSNMYFEEWSIVTEKEL